MVVWEKACKEGQEEGITKGSEGTLGDVHCLVVVASQIYTHARTHEIVHFICVELLVCKSYFNNPFGEKTNLQVLCILFRVMTEVLTVAKLPG